MFVKFLSLFLERKEDAKCSRKFDEFMSLHMRYPAVWGKNLYLKSYAFAMWKQKEQLLLHMRPLWQCDANLQCQFICVLKKITLQNLNACTLSTFICVLVSVQGKKLWTIIHFVLQAKSHMLCKSFNSYASAMWNQKE